MPGAMWIFIVILLVVVWIIIGQVFFAAAARSRGVRLDVPPNSAARPLELLGRIGSGSVSRMHLLTAKLDEPRAQRLRIAYILLTVVVGVALLVGPVDLAELSSDAVRSAALVLAAFALSFGVWWAWILHARRVVLRSGLVGLAGSALTAIIALVIASSA